MSKARVFDNIQLYIRKQFQLYKYRNIFASSYINNLREYISI